MEGPASNGLLQRFAGLERTEEMFIHWHGSRAGGDWDGEKSSLETRNLRPVVALDVTIHVVQRSPRGRVSI